MVFQHSFGDTRLHRYCCQKSIHTQIHKMGARDRGFQMNVYLLTNYCQSRPISRSIVTARWRLFCHVLRLPRDAPAQRAIDHYFVDTEAATFRGRPRTSLPTTLCSDLRDIEALRALSREQWRQMERDISA